MKKLGLHIPTKDYLKNVPDDKVTTITLGTSLTDVGVTVWPPMYIPDFKVPKVVLTSSWVCLLTMQEWHGVMTECKVVRLCDETYGVRWKAVVSGPFGLSLNITRMCQDSFAGGDPYTFVGTEAEANQRMRRVLSHKELIA